MRLLELSNETNSALSIQSGDEMSESKSDIASMLDVIKVIKQKFNDPVVQHLQQIKHSPRSFQYILFNFYVGMYYRVIIFFFLGILTS